MLNPQIWILIKSIGRSFLKNKLIFNIIMNSFNSYNWYPFLMFIFDYYEIFDTLILILIYCIIKNKSIIIIFNKFINYLTEIIWYYFITLLIKFNINTYFFEEHEKNIKIFIKIIILILLIIILYYFIKIFCLLMKIFGNFFSNNNNNNSNNNNNNNSNSGNGGGDDDGDDKENIGYYNSAYNHDEPSNSNENNLNEDEKLNDENNENENFNDENEIFNDENENFNEDEDLNNSLNNYPFGFPDKFPSNKYMSSSDDSRHFRSKSYIKSKAIKKPIQIKITKENKEIIWKDIKNLSMFNNSTSITSSSDSINNTSSTTSDTSTINNSSSDTNNIDIIDTSSSDDTISIINYNKYTKLKWDLNKKS